MKKTICMTLVICQAILMQAQDSTKTLDEVVVSGSKFNEKRKNITQKIDIISAKTIAGFNAQNTGDLLINTGNVFVQKSQQGGSSPVIRGFEASRVLLVVDGIRMNNAIYRSGHLQNVITVDQNMLEQVEVLYGPASTLYGSDALGGVVHMRTKAPKLSLTNKLLVTGTAFTRYSSVNDEKTAHLDLSIGKKKWAWLQSYNYSYFGDMRMGDNYPAAYPTFGRRDSMIVTVNGVDNVVANPDNRVQKFSGYKQWDITQKLLFKQNEKVSHSLNLQFSNTTDVPRYDRLQDKRFFNASVGTTLRYAEWYYGPQKRNLAAYELTVSQPGFADDFRLNVNYQDIEESRQTREYRRYDRFDSRVEKLKVWSFTADARKKWNTNELSFGADGQVNGLKSAATRTNLTTGAVTALDSRYPDGNNHMNYFGLFAQHIRKMKEGKLVLNDGIRLQTVSLHSTIANNSFFNLPYSAIKQNNLAFTGNIGLAYMPAADFRATVNFSSGFRAPNIDDLAKIFESSTSAKQVVMPNPDVKPERTYNIDLGFSQVIDKKLRVEFAGFYTLFRNALVKAPFSFNGQDSIVYNGVKSQVLANQNRNKAYLYGFNANFSLEFARWLSFYSTVSYTYGRYKKFTGQEVPLDHIPPVFGKTSLSFKKKQFSTELFGLFNGTKKRKNYNPDGEDNAQYATADGMPGWFTFNWRASLGLAKHFTAQLGVENIFDRNYRTFASGFSAPGRNLIIALRAGF